MCEITVLPARRLSAEHWEAWSRIQQSRSDLDSAFFRPELAQLVAEVRDDVEVAVLNDRERPVGFFPFQRGPRNIAQAVVGRLSEFHGVIAEASAEWTPRQLIKACGLAAWHFDHLPVSQTQFALNVWGESTSPYMDLSSGYEVYRDAIRSQGSSLTQVERKGRKLAREVGPLRFEYHTTDDQAFRALLDWKTEQHRRTKVLQVLKVDLVVNLLDRLRHVQTEQFQGVFSVLYAGEHLTAVHLGLCSSAALHIWFPAYQVEYEQYSPGLVLLLEMAKNSAARGVQRIDFGKGTERYKVNFKSADTRIAEGAVDCRWLTRNVRRGWYDTKRWIRTSPWRDQLEVPLSASRRLRQWMAFR